MGYFASKILGPPPKIALAVGYLTLKGSINDVFQVNFMILSFPKAPAGVKAKGLQQFMNL